MRVCEADPQQAGAIAALHAQALPPGWETKTFSNYIRSERHICFIARQHVIAGVAVVQLAAAEAELITLAVRPESRGLGLGSRLLTEVIHASACKGSKHLYLEVAEGNIPARHLYSRLGFTVIARREHYYQLNRTEPEAALICRLDLIRE